MNIQEAVDLGAALFEGKKVDAPRLSAELLVAHVTGLDRAGVIANTARALSPAEEREYNAFLQRRAKGEPIPYLTGRVEFYSLNFVVAPGVFIPRPETEVLVETALEFAVGIEVPKILDMGTGCGNVLISMAHHLDDGDFHGSDISNKAIQCAQQNVRDHDLSNYVTLYEGNMFMALRGSLVKNFNVFVSNPPYIKTADIPHLPAEVRNFEPHVCLDGGRDGLNFYRSLIDNVGPMLAPGGAVCMEIDPSLARPVSTLVERRREFTSPAIRKDHSGNDRIISFALK